MSIAYRALEAAPLPPPLELRARLAADKDSFERALLVARRRVGRAVGGGAGVVFGIAAFASALADLKNVWADAPARCLLAGWAAAVAVGCMARGLARLTLGGRVPRATVFDPTGILALERVDPLHGVRMLAMRWETASIALPLAAAALLGPLTLHWLVYAIATGGHPEGFGFWMGASAILVGPAHLALVFAAVRWARAVRRRDTWLVTSDLDVRCARALGLTCLVGCFPGLLLMAVPPLLVAMTGIVLIPTMFMVAARSIEQERVALELL